MTSFIACVIACFRDAWHTLCLLFTHRSTGKWDHVWKGLQLLHPTVTTVCTTCLDEHLWKKHFLVCFSKIPVVKSPFYAVGPVCLTPFDGWAGHRAQKCFPSFSHTWAGFEGKARMSPAFGATFKRIANGWCPKPCSWAEVSAAEPSSLCPWSSWAIRQQSHPWDAHPASSLGRLFYGSQ